MIRFKTFFGVVQRMLLRIEDSTLDPAEFRDTLAVRFNLPQEWEIESRQGVARCGVLLRNERNFRNSTWLPFDLTNEFQATVFLRQTAPEGADHIQSWEYEVYHWYQSRMMIPWTITLSYHPETWYCSFGPAGLSLGLRVILPDYVPLSSPQIEPSQT